MWYVYVLELANRDLYIGSTHNLRQRHSAHQAGHVPATRRLLPAALRVYVALSDSRTARRLEIYFKSGSGKALLKKRFLPSPGPTPGEA